MTPSSVTCDNSAGLLISHVNESVYSAHAGPVLPQALLQRRPDKFTPTLLSAKHFHF